MSAPAIRVLVIDDDARVRTAVGRTVALEPDLVLAGDARDAVSALETAEWCDPSVALVDVLMPDEASGIGVIRALSQRRGCAVVAMSVRGGMRAAALGAGAASFTEKGDIDAILAHVRTAALRHSAESAPAA